MVENIGGKGEFWARNETVNVWWVAIDNVPPACGRAGTFDVFVATFSFGERAETFWRISRDLSVMRLKKLLTNSTNAQESDCFRTLYQLILVLRVHQLLIYGALESVAVLWQPRSHRDIINWSEENGGGRLVTSWLTEFKVHNLWRHGHHLNRRRARLFAVSTKRSVMLAHGRLTSKKRACWPAASTSTFQVQCHGQFPSIYYCQIVVNTTDVLRIFHALLFSFLFNSFSRISIVSAPATRRLLNAN